MNENSVKEEFSYGYIHALASVCGYITHRSERQLDNIGIDLQIIGMELDDSEAPRISVQSKCTTWKYFRKAKDRVYWRIITIKVKIEEIHEIFKPIY